MFEAMPFDRQPKEPRKAWTGFATFQRLGPKSKLAAVCEETRSSLTVVQKWSSKWKWAERAAAWDAHIDATVTQPAIIKARGEMAERQANLGKALQGRAAQGLQNIKPEKLRPTEVAALAKAGVDIERVAA